jgi:hypothetical protein
MFGDRRNRAKAIFAPGGSVVFDLDMGGKVLDGSIIIHGVLPVTAGTTNGTVIGEGGPLNLVKHVTLTCYAAQGSRYPSGKYVDVTPRSLARFAVVQRGGRYMAENAISGGASLGNGAAGTYSFYQEIPIYFADPTARNPLQTALNLDAGVYQSVQLQVDLASDLTTCFAGNDRTAALANLFVEWKDSRLAIPGDTIPLIQEEHVMQIGSTFDRKQDLSMPTDGNFIQWLILGEQSTAQTLSDALLNKLTVTGSNGVLEEYANDIRTRMYSDNWYDVAQSGVGQYFIDWVNGANQNAEPAVGLSAQWDINLVSAVNQDQLRIFTRRWLPLKAA